MSQQRCRCRRGAPSCALLCLLALGFAEGQVAPEAANAAPVPAPSGISASVSSLKISHTRAYVADIAVGTPPQRLRCLLDSGSADLWVPSRRCESCSRDTKRFDAYQSSTMMAKTQQTPQGFAPVAVHLSYGSGEIVGYYVQDTVSFGSVSLPNQTFIIVEDAGLPPHSSWDGICGLGWRSIASAGEPLYRHLQQSGRRALFTLVPETAGSAYVVVGDIPEGAYRPETLAWAKAESLQSLGEERSFWVASGGLAVHQAKPVDARFLIDTGTTNIMVPPRFFHSMIKSLFPEEVFNRLCGLDASSGNLVVCDCSVRDPKLGLLPLRIYLGSRAFVLQVPQLFDEVQTDDGQTLCLLRVERNPLAASAPVDALDRLMDPLAGGFDPFGMDPFGGDPFRMQPPVLEPFGERGDSPPSASAADMGDPFDQAPMSLPFKFPFPMDMDPGAPMDPIGGLAGAPAAQVGEEVQQEVQTRPDGSVCRTTTTYRDGRVVHRSSRCSQPAARRLQQAPKEEEAMNELFVIGGAFLQHFVAVFDFDNARIGFAEPVANAALAPSRLDLVQPEAAAAAAGGSAWFVLSVMAVVSLFAACAWIAWRRIQASSCDDLLLHAEGAAE